MTDQEIIASIREGNREKALRFLYNEYPKIRALVLKSGCNEIVAKELFNDSLLLLIEKVQQPAFELTAKLTTYLYGINRFLVKNELRKQQRTGVELEWSDTLILSESDLGYDMEKEEKFRKLEYVMQQVSERCREIFNRFYLQKESMEMIASALDYASVNSAKTQKYKCLERAHELAKQAPDSYSGHFNMQQS